MEHERLMCEWALVFVLLHTHPDNNDDWYVMCTDIAYDCPDGSYRSAFWWSLRELDGDLEEDRLAGVQPLTNWRDYLAWKLEQHGHRR